MYYSTKLNLHEPYKFLRNIIVTFDAVGDHVKFNTE
jgi:hypothetical protein